jgi:hypothetical protein
MRDRLLRDGFVMLGAAFVLLRLLNVPPWDQSVDAYSYWSTRGGTYYDLSAVGTMGAYLYSPAWAQLLAPLVLLPWPLFNALWTTINLGTYWALVGRLALPLLLFLPFPFEIVSGNVHLLYALAIVVGFRYPAAWALMFITKVTPGVGVVWFAVRREWRSLAIALGATAAIVAVSYVLAPAEWAAWIRTLQANEAAPLETLGWYLPVPLLVRLPIALAIVAWGGLTDRRWTVPIAVVVAMPVLWLNSLAVLAALVPLAPRSISLPRFRPVPVERLLARRTA